MGITVLHCAGCDERLEIARDLGPADVLCPGCGALLEREAPAGKTAKAPDPWRKRTVAGCRLRQRLKATRLSLCYLADHKRLRMPVLIEVFPHDRPGYAEPWMNTLLGGLNAASAVRHPNMVSVIDIGRREDCDFVVTEWIGADSLRKTIAAKGRMSVDTALPMAEGILMALAAGDEKDLPHGAVRPDVVLLDYDATPKLADYGRSLRRGDLYEFTLTQDGVLTGHCFCIAPERIEELDDPTARSDLYGLGVTLYEALGGARPFDGPTAHDILGAGLAGVPVPLRERAQDVPAEVADFVSRLMSRDPDSRPADAAAALGETREIGLQLSRSKKAAKATATQRGLKRLKSSTMWVALAVALVVLSVIPALRMARMHKEERAEPRRPLNIVSPDRVAALMGAAAGSGAAELPAELRRGLLVLAASQLDCIGGLVTAGPFLSEDLQAADMPPDGQIFQQLPPLRLTITHSPGLGRRKWHMAFVNPAGDGWMITEQVVAAEGESDIAMLGPALKKLLTRAIDKLFEQPEAVPLRWPDDGVWSDGPRWITLGSAVAAEYDGRWKDALRAVAPSDPTDPASVLGAFYADARLGRLRAAPGSLRARLPGESEKLGEVLKAAQNGPATAEPALAAYLAAYPSSPRAHFALGLWRSTVEGTPDGEIAAAFWQALKKDPSYLPAAQALAQMAAAKGADQLDAVLARYRSLPHTEIRLKALEDYCDRLRTGDAVETR